MPVVQAAENFAAEITRWREVRGVSKKALAEQLALTAVCRGESMRWQAKHDRDAFKEVWLLFENDQGRFPLYPGESVRIEYACTVSDEKWGRWFQKGGQDSYRAPGSRAGFPRRTRPGGVGNM